MDDIKIVQPHGACGQIQKCRQHFDAGGLATEAWTFEGQEMTTDSVLANPTESVFTEMTAAAGYGGAVDVPTGSQVYP